MQLEVDKSTTIYYLSLAVCS